MNTMSPTISPEDLAVDLAEPSSNDVLVRVENVSKKFCRGLKKSLWYGLKDVAHELNPFSSRHATDTTFLRPDEFLAVDDVSFELRRGECLGLIGHNGAGKTTLLKMLNGLIKPDSGRIEMRGRIGALIALGAGFNPILTGRENIYVNASVLGMTRREIDRQVDDIIDFAEVREFIDMPVQSYSSGMAVRLGFAIASTLNPDVMLLDEVLAVGDVAFRAKCFNRLGELRKRGTSFILVSHQLRDISRYCRRAIYLTQGRIYVDADVDQAISRYLTDAPGRKPSSYENEDGRIMKSGAIRITAVEVTMSDFGPVIDVNYESHSSCDIEFQCDFTINDTFPDLIKTTVVHDADRSPLIAPARGQGKFEIRLSSLFPNNCQWDMSLSLWDPSHTEQFDWVRGITIACQPLAGHYGRIGSKMVVKNYLYGDMNDSNCPSSQSLRV